MVVALTNLLLSLEPLKAQWSQRMKSFKSCFNKEIWTSLGVCKKDRLLKWVVPIKASKEELLLAKRWLMCQGLTIVNIWIQYWSLNCKVKTGRFTPPSTTSRLRTRKVFFTFNFWLDDIKKFRNFENLSKEDSLLVFKDLLKDVGVTTSWKWEDANRVI